MTRTKHHFFILFAIVFMYSCKMCYITHPSCLLAPSGTTNVKKNKYYKKDFIKTDSVLSTTYVYEHLDTLTDNSHKYRYQSFLFYSNGLVLEDYYYTDTLPSDTIRTFSKNLISACCHGWSIGSFTVKNDTVYFGAKPGYKKDWSYYGAEIENNGLRVFRQEQGSKTDSTTVYYRKNMDRPVLKIIKI